MTKAELVVKISKKTGLPKEEVLTVVEALMKGIKESLTDGESVFLRGFGSFTCKTRARKTARNISADKTIIIPEHSIPHFKPCEEFKEALAPGLQNTEN